MKDAVVIHVEDRLAAMRRDSQFKEIAYNLRQLLLMEKEAGPFERLAYNIERKVLEIPSDFLEQPYEDQDWMLVHEACHFYQGHDVLLKRGVALLERLNNKYLDLLHELFEWDANLQAIRIIGKSFGAEGKPASLFVHMKPAGEDAVCSFIMSMDTHLLREIKLAKYGSIDTINNAQEEDHPCPK